MATTSGARVRSTSSASSSTCSTSQPAGTLAARYGMVICWKFRNRERRARLISSDEAVINRSFGMAAGARRSAPAAARIDLGVHRLSRGHHLRIDAVGHGREADVIVLSIHWAAGERFVRILEEVAAHE